MLPSAKIQESALAEKIRTDPEFVDYILSKTKHPVKGAIPVLVRSDNPWYQSKLTGRQSETDILAVFQLPDGRTRFALHFENKRAGDRFRHGQASEYKARATDWMNVEKWGNYSDFQCVLIASTELMVKDPESTTEFDVVIDSGDLAEFVPEFGSAAS